MDFTLFANRDIIPALAWLGRREWLEFGCGSFEQRTIWTRTKELVISDEERSKYSPEHWKHVHEIVQSCSKDVVASFLSLALSKSIAGGPKVFQPTPEDCEALENTECSMSFEEYKQPYPVVIIEFPKVYRQKLARIWKVAYGPSHVIVHHDKDFITVNAFFDRKNVISHITPSRPEYKTIEDAIALNKDKNEEADVNAAELAQRLAINFCMVMVLLGVRQVGPLDKESFEKAKKLARSPDEKKAALGKKLVSSAMYKLQFIQQKIKPKQIMNIDTAKNQTL